MNTDLFTVETLSMEQLRGLIPWMVFLGFGLLSLLGSTLKEAKGVVFAQSAAVVGCLVSGFFLINDLGVESVSLMGGMVTIDRFSRFFSLIIIAVTLAVVLLSRAYNQQERMNSEFYSLLLFSALGMIAMASTYDMVFLFISIEIMSLAVYILVTMRRSSSVSAEAGLKYFILGGIASAVLLYGTTLLYGATGSTNLIDMVQQASLQPAITQSLLFMTGLLLVLAGFLFKVGAFPFQMWIPDVYEGAATSTTAFMIAAVKAAAFAALVRFSVTLLPALVEPSAQFFHHVLWILAVATMLFGNCVALLQNNLKRLFAYSTIAHTGYLIIGIIAAAKSSLSYTSVLLYLLFYVIMSVGAFAVLCQMAAPGDKNLTLDHIKGLGFKHPVLGIAMSLFLFSMAGIPPTAGFLGKYYLFSAAVEAGEIWLAVLGVLASLIGATYYLRVLVVMYMKEADHSEAEFPMPRMSAGAVIAITVCALLTMQFGILPSALLSQAQQAVAELQSR